MRAAEVMTPPAPRDLGIRMAKGAAWMIALRFAIRGIGLVSMIILARLLVPADFGLVAIATALAGALAAMSEFGFQVALIQNQAAGRRHYDTAWTLGIVRGLVVAGALAASASPLAALFSDPRLKPVLLVLALGVIITAFENIAVVDFRRDLHFKMEFVYRGLAKITSAIVTIPLAIVLRSYWALVSGMVAGQLGGVLLSYLMCSYRPRPCLAAWRELIRFSKWLLLNNILYFAYHRVDTFVIGRFVGAQPLGLFRMAHEIASLPTTEMVAPIRAAILPGYAKLASDQERLRASFAATFGTIVMMAVPVAVGIGLTADPLVRLILGEKWLQAIPLLEVLCIAGAVNVCTANTWPVFIALGRPWINTALTALGIVVLIPLLLWSVPRAGTVGAAWSLVAAAAVVLTANLVATLRLLSVSGWDLVAQIWRTLAAVTAMTGAMLGVGAVLPSGEGLVATAASLACAVVAGAATYIVFLWLLWRLSGLAQGPEQKAIGLLQAWLGCSLAAATPAARMRPSAGETN
jgi:lipopolysaccharide exporter